MRTLLQLAAALTLLALSVCAAVLTSDAHKLSRDAQLFILDSDMATRRLYASLTALDAVTTKSAGLIDETEATAANLKRASAAEAEYWNATAKQTALAAP